MLSRLGCALFLIGTILMIVFLVTLSGQQADSSTFLFAVFFCGLGWLLRRKKRRGRKDSPARFRSIRRLLRRQPPDDEEL